MAITTRNVRFDIRNPDQSAATGTVVLVRDYRLSDSADHMVSGPGLVVRVPFAAAPVTQAVPVNDDPDEAPQGWPYLVTVHTTLGDWAPLHVWVPTGDGSTLDFDVLIQASQDPPADPTLYAGINDPRIVGAVQVSDLADATAAVVLAASNGSDDTSAINTILAANAGKVVKGRPGQSYLISAPLVVYSGTTLDMTGCTITLIAGSGCNMLQNRAVTTVRRALDAVTTASSTTLTSATAAFVVGDVGKAITIQGAGAAGVPLTTTVAGYTNATTVTLAVAASTSVTGQYVAIGTRESGITVIGGHWDRLDNNSTPPHGWDAHSLRFRHVDGLTVRDLSLAATSGKYAVNAGDCTKIRVERITLPDYYSSDGVHFNGPCSQIIVRSIIGNTMGDDLVSFTARDSQAVITDCAGDISDVTVDNVMFAVSQPTLFASALKLVAGKTTDESANYSIRNLRARNLTCPTATASVAFIGDLWGGTFYDISVENVTSLGGSSDSQKVVQLHGETIMDRIRISNVTQHITDGGIVAIDAAVGHLIVENCQFECSRDFAGTVIVALGSVDHLILDRVHATMSGTSPSLVRLANSTSAVGDMLIANCDLTSTTASQLVRVTAGATLTSVQVTNLKTSGVTYPLGLYTGTTTLAAANVKATGMTAWLYASTSSAAVTVSSAVGLAGDADGFSADAPGFVAVANRNSILSRDPDTLTSGESTMPRIISTSDAQLASGTLVLTYFTAQKTETIANVRTIIRGTATSAPTLCRIGIYSVAANGDLTLVASTANDTTLWNGTFSAHTRALSASWAKVAGRRYAVGELFVGTTGPRLSGLSPLVGSEGGQAPRINGSLAGQSDLPSSIAVGSVSNSFGASIYAAMTP